MQVTVYPQHRLADLLPGLNARMDLLYSRKAVMPLNVHRQRPLKHHCEYRIGTPLHGRPIGHVVGQPWSGQKQ